VQLVELWPGNFRVIASEPVKQSLATLSPQTCSIRIIIKQLTNTKFFLLHLSIHEEVLTPATNSPPAILTMFVLKVSFNLNLTPEARM
jgi:hypothetical protein